MANTHLSGGAVMGHHLPLLLFLSLEAWRSSAFGQNTCGQFSYHRQQGLDDKTFTQDALLVKVYTAEKTLTECSFDCFRHSSCNMFVLNPISGECRRFKRAFSDFTHASSASGFQYYGASCDLYKSSQCRDGFSLYPGTESVESVESCFSAGIWIPTRSSITVCKQDEWINTAEVNIPLPAPIVPGVIIDIRGSRKANSELFTVLRQQSGNKETTLLRVTPDNRTLFGVFTGVGWVGYHTIDPFPIAAEVVFDVKVIVTETQFQVKLNGNDFTTVDVGNPLNISTLIRMYYWRSVERVKLTYP